MATAPTTLIEAVRYFEDEMTCIEYVAGRRWPHGVTCPVCGSQEVTWLDSVKRWQCRKRHAKRQFTAKTGSIFEDSPLPLSKWLVGMWLIVNAKNGISSYEIHRALGITQKSAWFLLHRIRYAMRNNTLEKLGDDFGAPVEVDETFMGGKERNKHVRNRSGNRGTVGKTIVMGFLERQGEIRTKLIEHTDSKIMVKMVEDNVEFGSAVYTDAHGAYRRLKGFRHAAVDHAYSYVKDQVHTNGLENYWSLLKRTIHGTYVSVEPYHLQSYLDEQAFRFNERKDNDSGRFNKLTGRVSGKRLTYRQLTGKESVQRIPLASAS